MAFVTGSVYDNYWVSHPIPRSDLQYSWITASILHSNPYPLSASTFGHAPADGYVSSSVEGIVPAYNFVSASDFGSYINVLGSYRYYGARAGSNAYLSNDIVGLNSNIYDPITSSDNFLGYPDRSGQTPADFNYKGGLITYYSTTGVGLLAAPGSTYILNGLLLHRNGPYGYPSWKQIRTGEHPVARKHRSTNHLSVQDIPSALFKGLPMPARAPTFTQYNEPPATSKFMAVNHNIKQMGASIPHWYRYTHGNNLNMFSYENLNKRLGLLYEGGTIYDEIFNVYDPSNADPTNPVEEFLGLTYKEIVYPREINTFLGRSRKRDNFVFSSWRIEREDRQQIHDHDIYYLDANDLNSQGYPIETSSMWSLDARDNFVNSSIIGGQRDGAGELQNGYTIFHEGDSCINPIHVNESTLKLNGIDEYVELVSGSNLYCWLDYPTSGTHASASFSISAWFKTTADDSADISDNMTILAKTSPSHYYSIFYQGGTKTLWGRVGTGDAINTGIDIVDNQWHHVVLTSDGASSNIWLDGVFKGAETPGLGINSSLYDSILIGAYNDSTPTTDVIGFFDGHIDEVSFWNTFLTSSVDDDGEATSGMIYDLYNPQERFPHEHELGPDPDPNGGQYIALAAPRAGCPTDLTQYFSASVLFEISDNNILEVEGLAGQTARDDFFAISMWIRRPNISNEKPEVLYYAASSALADAIMVSNDGYIVAEIGLNELTSDGSGSLLKEKSVDDNFWHHILVINSADDGSGNQVSLLYIDGVVIDSDTNLNPSDAPVTGSVYFGNFPVADVPVADYSFSGYIDEISVWGFKTVEELFDFITSIATLYNSGTPTNLVNYSVSSVTFDDVLAWYRMGDDSRDSVAVDGDYIYDQTSNNYHATASGFVAPYGIINHAPEAIDAWYRFGALDYWVPPKFDAHWYNDVTRDQPQDVLIEESRRPYAHPRGNGGDPTAMIDPYEIICPPTQLPCPVGALYARRVPEYDATGKELGYFPGDTLWEAGVQSGKDPFYDSYDDYREQYRGSAKDYTIVPEFRISEHMDFYVGQKNYDFLAPNDGFLTLEGASISSSANPDFFEKYNHSDFLKYFDVIEDDHKPFEKDKTLTLKCNAFMKFLPYDGFYPADRTLQLATLFSQSYANNVNISQGVLPFPGGTQPSWRTFIAPLFGPGLLYNSIKSGVAVDWPQMTGSYDITGTTNPEVITGVTSSVRINSNFHYRIPFEALVEPEHYLTTTLVDMEPHPSASLNSTSSWGGVGSELYRAGMHNFLAESVNFFLDNNNVSTLVSQPDNNPSYFNADENKEYKMRVVLRNSKLSRKKQILDSLPPYYFAWIKGSDITIPTMTMYDRPSAFGPPTQAPWQHRQESYEPFTPPYYDGYSEVELTFKPTDTRRYYLDEIVSQMTSEYYRIGTQFTSFSSFSQPAYDSKMQISASINFDVVTRLDNTTFESLTGRAVSVMQDENTPNVWSIQPKWETPILDFSNVSITLPISGSGSVSKGMWHQYGSVPTAEQGIYLEVQDLDKRELDNPILTGSLAKLVGFPTSIPIKLGKVGQSFTIREALVAVPFIEEKGESKFFKLSREQIDAAKFKLKMRVDREPEIEVGDTIVNMIDAMTRYVFPPTMDFLTYDLPSLEPFVMYIFEFEHILSGKDLTDIWQNLPPDIGTSFKTNTVSIQHKILEEEFFGCEDEIPDKLRWMVFKVKQRAEKNYYDKIRKAVWDEKYQSFSRYGNTEGTTDYIPPYSYNWPYDFFSLIEMVKLETDVSIGGAGPIQVVLPPQVAEMILVTAPNAATATSITLSSEIFARAGRSKEGVTRALGRIGSFGRNAIDGFDEGLESDQSLINPGQQGSEPFGRGGGYSR